MLPSTVCYICTSISVFVHVSGHLLCAACLATLYMMFMLGVMTVQPTGPQIGVPPPGSGETLDLPPVPQTRLPKPPGASGGGDVDFDDLTRRFEELKRKK